MIRAAIVIGLVVAVLYRLFELFRTAPAVRSLSGPEDVQSNLGDESAAEAFEKAERLRWSRALGIPVSAVDFDLIDEYARAQGGPDNWEGFSSSDGSKASGLGWPTPCGPTDDPRIYCPNLLDQLQSLENPDV